MKYIFVFFVIYIDFFPTFLSAQQLADIPVTRVWDKAPHNAFPDLIRFNNHFYAAVREGNNHMPDNSGQVR